jgi:ribonuclease BN (tRNA processing enzyme)
MAMQLTFAGAGSAFTVGTDNYHSNMVLTVDDPGPAQDGAAPGGPRRLLIDCGSDARFSLPRIGVNGPADLDAVYVSHLHADHVGGLEWLALLGRYGVPTRRLKLFCPEDMVESLWSTSLAGGLAITEEGSARLSDYFDVQTVGPAGFTFCGVDFTLVPVPHVGVGEVLMRSYGLWFTAGGVRVYLTTDAKFDGELATRPYAQNADVIFHDCETGPPSGVHSHYSDLCTLPPELRRRMWLYHYNPGPLPEVTAQGFRGLVQRGQCFDFRRPETL